MKFAVCNLDVTR